MAEEQIDIPKTGDFDINNLEVVRTANYLDLKYDDLIDKQVSDKMKSVFNKYQSEKTDKSFLEYARDLNSQLGYRAGIHPLDKIYTFLTIKDQLKQKEKQKDKEKTKLLDRRNEELARIKKEKELMAEKREILEERGRALRLRQRVEAEKEVFREKVKMATKLLKEI